MGDGTAQEMRVRDYSQCFLSAVQLCIDMCPIIEIVTPI